MSELVYRKVQRRTARRRFEAGETVYALPNRLRIGPWTEPLAITKRADNAFEWYESNLMYYNCGRETGRRLTWYVID